MEWRRGHTYASYLCIDMTSICYHRGLCIFRLLPTVTMQPEMPFRIFKNTRAMLCEVIQYLLTASIYSFAESYLRLNRVLPSIFFSLLSLSSELMTAFRLPSATVCP
jgi:hypothetical protein